MTLSKNVEELIQGIQLFLAKNRSSLSVSEIVLLEDTVKFLRELQSVKKSFIRKTLLTKVANNLFRIFAAYKTIEKMKEIFEDFEM